MQMTKILELADTDFKLVIIYILRNVKKRCTQEMCSGKSQQNKMETTTCTQWNSRTNKYTIYN